MKSIITTFFLLITVIVTAQVSTSLKVTESEPFSEKKIRTSFTSITTNSKGEIATARIGESQILFNILNKSLTKIYNSTIKISDKEFFIGEYADDDQIRVFTILIPKKRIRKIKYYTFNRKTKLITEKLLFEENLEVKQYINSSNYQYIFKNSPNGKYFVINTHDKKKNSHSLTAKVYDSKALNLLYKKTYRIPEGRIFRPVDSYLTDNKNFYVVGTSHYQDKKESKSKKMKYTYTLKKISADNISHLEIKSGNEYINSLFISKNQNSIHLLGFYSEKYVRTIDGTCSFIIDLDTFTLDTKVLNPLSLNIYTDLFGKGSNPKKEFLSDFKTNHIIQDSQRNTYLIAEEASSKTFFNAPQGSLPTSLPYYNDIIIFKIDSNGKLLWSRGIYKRSNEPSYNAFVKNDQLHLILNSGKELLQKNDGRTKVQKGLFEKSALYNIYFNKNGKITYNKIRNNKRKDTYFPHTGKYSNGRFIMRNYFKSKRRLLFFE